MSPENQQGTGTESRIAELLNSPEPAALESISIAFARLARIAPLSCDTSANLVTMAIDDSKRIPAVQAQFHFLMTPFEPTFVTVSPVELDAVLKRIAEPAGIKADGPATPSGPKTGAPAVPTLPGAPPAARKSLLGTTPGAAPAARLFALGSRPAIGAGTAPKPAAVGAKFSFGGAKPQHPQQPQQPQQPAAPDMPDYAEMSRALLSAISLIVRSRLGNDQSALSSLQTIVRHCQMLAARMTLPPLERDAVLAAAWLSGLADARDVLNQLPTPYHLDAILGKSRDGTNPRVEASIVELVRAYQSMSERDPSACRDVNKVRRSLRAAVPQGATDVLEPFLGILMDEVFLSTLDRKAGTLLLVDPAEMASATLGPPLAADGYEVLCAADTAEAVAKMAGSKPDLVILSASLPDEAGSAFCRRLKREGATAAVPVIVLLDEPNEKLAAECLRAGAEDVLTKPVALELLFLKLQRLMDAAGSASAKAATTATGVSGSLADMAFTDMIQILSAGGKSVEIRMTSGSSEGHIFLQAGKIIHAAVDDQQGEEAFYIMMAWKEGSFSMKPPARFPERTIHSDAMGLLMEGAKRLDDIAEQSAAK